MGEEGEEDEESEDEMCDEKEEDADNGWGIQHSP